MADVMFRRAAECVAAVANLPQSCRISAAILPHFRPIFALILPYFCPIFALISPYFLLHLSSPSSTYIHLLYTLLLSFPPSFFSVMVSPIFSCPSLLTSPLSYILLLPPTSTPDDILLLYFESVMLVYVKKPAEAGQFIQSSSTMARMSMSSKVMTGSASRGHQFSRREGIWSYSKS